MVNPFAYDEYRQKKIREQLDKDRSSRVQIKVGRPSNRPVFDCNEFV